MIFRVKELCLKKVLVLLLSLFLITGMMAGCGGDIEYQETNEDELTTSNQDAKEEQETERIQSVRLEGRDAGFPNPFTHYPRMRGTVMKKIFDSLLEPDEEKCIPWLAKNWDISDDGKTHIIDIQEGVKWHDGEDMTARDVVFSFEYYQEHHPVFIGQVLTDKDYIKSIEATSDYQVKIVTSEPNATFFCEAGMLRIIPEHIWKDVDDPYEFTEPESTIGCGPFVLTDYSKEHGTYRYEAFDEYWGPEQRMEAIEYVPVSDELLALENGDISISRISPDVVSRFEGDPQFQVVNSPAFAGTMISFNMNENDLFQDKEFRQAVAYAIDKEDIIEKVIRGAGKPGSPGILPVDHQYYNPDVSKYNYNPDKARDILQELNISQDLSFELLVSEGPELRAGELIKEQLDKVGIDLNVVAVDSKTRDSRANEGKYEMAILAMGAWGLDADYIRIRYHSGLGEDVGGSATAILGRNQGYENSNVDDLLDEQLRETDREKREEIFDQIQEKLAEDVPEIPLYNNYYYYAYRAQEYDGWTFMFDHAVMEHAKLSYLERN